MNIKLRSFASKIAYFNGMYGLPVAPYPTIHAEVRYQQLATGNSNLESTDCLIRRNQDFHRILRDEVNEVQDIIESLRLKVFMKGGVPCAKDRKTKLVEGQEPVVYTEFDFLTDMADWLGDLTIYCASEAQRYGLDMQQVLDIIMKSNFSKLGEDGKPIIRDGKVQKGPFFFPPEPQLEEYIRQARAEAGL